ncbi:uncharacterized protein LOC118736000 [Rhagoletis pomonella]|uniref:uncharacterized protein LOC118736000 n=1 Tax=Rhagoletis pomonella TaxID=28610 RepID=UPI001782AE0B|nr:uncharacterized protein LOC118736000 [Rhagoletis pomonella]
MRAAVTTPSNAAPVRCQSEHRLDPVKIPAFDGQPEDWLMFKDIFESLVHNRTDLDDRYKLSRLRQCVHAQAVPMVGGVYTGAYSQLWAELKRRYDNPRRLVESHVYRLFDLPEHPVLTQHNVHNIIDVVRSTLRALNVKGLATDQWDAIVCPIVPRKLPTPAVSHWTVLYHAETLPNLQKMLEEIETYADTLRCDPNVSLRPSTARRVAQSHVVTPKSLNATMKSSLACPRCSEPHRLSRCPQFRALTVDQRLNLVRQAYLCYNCLGTSHSARECSSISCNNCKQKHNTLLCKTSSCIGKLPATTSAATRPAPAFETSIGAITPQVLPRIDVMQSLLA